jgi:hypothetical protein
MEGSLGRGGIAVEYTGCEMRVLSGCELPGQYQWSPTTVATDVLEITDEDELRAKLPLGGSNLEAALTRAGRLSVQTTVSGQMRLTGASGADVPSGGQCARATHLLQAVSVGAFQLDSGGTVHAHAGADTHSASLGGSSSSEHTVLRRAGDATRCGGALDTPNVDCRSPLQAFLVPLPNASNGVGTPGSFKGTFVSADPELPWEIRRNNETLCTTPCTRWVEPSETLRLRSYGPNGAPTAGGYKIDLPSLLHYQQGQSLHVQAEARKKGRLTDLPEGGFLGLTPTGVSGRF